MDALFALAFAAVILSLPLVLSENSAEYAGFNHPSILGRDYLVLKHYYKKNVVPNNFTSMTGLGLSESEPSDSNQRVFVVYYRYPNFFNCTSSTSCSFSNSSTNASYASGQDVGVAYKYVAWVTP